MTLETAKNKWPIDLLCYFITVHPVMRGSVGQHLRVQALEPDFLDKKPGLSLSR